MYIQVYLLVCGHIHIFANVCNKYFKTVLSNVDRLKLCFLEKSDINIDLYKEFPKPSSKLANLIGYSWWFLVCKQFGTEILENIGEKIS